MRISIDVVIPTFRLQEKFILPLLDLQKPMDADVQYFIVVDNPDLTIPPDIRQRANLGEITLIVNDENKGAAATRNKGIDAGRGEWILFLDDDIIAPRELLLQYARAIETFPFEMGFIGYVEFPAAKSNFTKAVVAGGSMDIFSIALRKDFFAWGATANIMINRQALKGTRFSRVFPKKGGGEDVDFFLKIREANGNRDFKTLPAAKVIHPWWTGEKADYRRPFRYGIGNSLLGVRHRRNTYYDFFNTPETLLLSLVFLLVVLFVGGASVLKTIYFMAGILLIEYLATSIQLYKRQRTWNPSRALYMSLLRLSQEAGVLWGKLSRGSFWRLGERFHDDGKVKKIYFFRLNSYKMTKWLLYPALLMLLL